MIILGHKVLLLSQSGFLNLALETTLDVAVHVDLGGSATLRGAAIGEGIAPLEDEVRLAVDGLRADYVHGQHRS